MNAVATIQPSRLPISPSIAKEFDILPAEWRVLVEQIFPAAKSVESVMMALAYCRKRNLDIFKKPVHIVPMWSSAKRQMVETVWPGISEIRTTAARTGEYAGIDAVEFGPLAERTFNGVTGGNNSESITKTVRFPEWASVVVYRLTGGVRCAYHAKVYWEETYATIGKTEVPNEMWAKRPRGQLDKCVEAAALRKAFPEELGNTYAAEEMEGRTIEAESVPAPKPPSPPKAPPAAPAAAKPEPQSEPPGDMLDADQFFTELDAALANAGSADLVQEVWDSFDVEATLTHDELAMQRAFDLRKSRLERLAS
jgi:phage recombination protein Bet